MIQDELENTSAIEKQEVTPKDLLKFAKSILICIAILFLLGAISQLIMPNSGVFEACKTILPSLSTLVIGFYFAKS